MCDQPRNHHKKMDLVSREEFDTQQLVLRRAHQKLAELEEKLDHLARLKDKKTTAKTKVVNKTGVNKKIKEKASISKENVKTKSATRKRLQERLFSISKKRQLISSHDGIVGQHFIIYAVSTTSKKQKPTA